MANDKQTYDRGVHASIIGLIVHFILSIAVFILGIWTHSHALTAASWHMGAGLPIWIILALIYHQHRVYLRESQSAELMAEQDAESAALFGDRSDELLLAERRLKQLYKWGLNLVSAAVGIYLITDGLLLHLVFEKPKVVMNPEVQPITLGSISIGIALIAFLVGRWIAGYTKVREWQLLRGGASFLMSVFLMVLLTAISAFMTFFFEQSEWLFKLLDLVIPIMMVVIGTEILLNLLFSFYRPRRMGEIPRPAFDSRVLGMLTSSESLGQVVAETINYQFGFDVSGKDLYKNVSKSLPILVLFLVAVLMLLSCFVIVDSHQNGILLRNGKYVEVKKPGLHVKLPWPIEVVDFFDVGRIEQVRTGSFISTRENVDSLLWDSDVDRMFGSDHFMTTSVQDAEGLNMLAIEAIVHYRVVDLEKFRNTAMDPRSLVGFITERALTRYCHQSDMYDLLTASGTEVGGELKKSITEELSTYDLGLEIVFVGMTGVHPPLGKVSRSFQDPDIALQESEMTVTEAKQDDENTYLQTVGSMALGKQITAISSEINDLNAQLQDTLPEAETEVIKKQLQEKYKSAQILLDKAEGVVAKKLLDARKVRWEKLNSEVATLNKFEGELEAYRKAPYFYKNKRFLEVLAKGLRERRKFIIIGENGEFKFDLDFTEEVSAVSSIFGQKKK